MKPMVTVIALCYNHKAYLQEALRSVFRQTYPAMEIIVSDDCSSDGSAELIRNVIREYRGSIRFLQSEQNLGNCRSFNNALKQASGKYIIDFATDDLMMPDMVEYMVAAFEELPQTYGVLFSDAVYINAEGKFLKQHFKPQEYIPSGDVYKDVVQRYFIAPPAVMMRKSMIDDLGGYDETLAYEDFDWWVRASRNSYFHFLHRVTVKKRVHAAALSNSFYLKASGLQESTYRVCEKIRWLNKDDTEHRALQMRIRYEMKVACLTGNFQLYGLYKKLMPFSDTSPAGYMLSLLAALRLDLSSLYRLFRRLRQGHLFL